MNGLITLNCPSCGGKMEVIENKSVLTCKHCGSEHLVRREGGALTLESYARCPKCGRNDRVEKVTAILRSLNQELNQTEIKLIRYLDKYGNEYRKLAEVPKKPSPLPGIAKFLVIRYEDYPIPNYKYPSSTKANVGGVLIALSVISLIIAIAFLPILIFSFLSMIIGIALLIIGLKQKKSIIEENEQLEILYERKLQNWKFVYKQIVKAYDSLYYCYRDDCVFILNKRTSAPIENMMSYLYENMEF